jgi:hypothetical protein
MRPLSLVLFALLCSCGSTLLKERVDGTAFTSEEKCAQGPFEKLFTTVEAPYGQALILHFKEGSSQAQLHYRVESDGNLFQSGLIGTTQISNGTDSQGNTQYKDFVPPSPCLAKVETGGTGTGTPTNIVVTPVVTSDTPPTGIMPPIKTIPEPGDEGHYLEIKLPDWPAGKTFKIILWSDVPYYIGEGWISIRLIKFYPKDPAKYAAWEAKQKQKDEIRDIKHQSRSHSNYTRREIRHQRRESRKKHRRENVTPREVKRAENTASIATADWEAFKKKDQERLIEIDAAMPELKLTLQISRRDAFYQVNGTLYDAYDKLIKYNDEKTLDKFQDVLREAGVLEDQWHKWTQENEVALKANQVPQPTDPPGPPPLPWAEERGQAPVSNATWRPGYWQWSGFAWVWYSGDWEFPPQTPTVTATPTVVTAPPPPKEEVITTPPQTGYVWITGAWRWNGTTYVWKKGIWVQLPSNATPPPKHP